ncbi:hypothetical protein AB0H36_43095, partial [Kribbella sp. NPDC050820]|uniref:hypothetical protein n=1 Tax=Kribbella sp. NPDC050820 TaxID=3155408 RepID=UPI0033FDECA4
ALAMFATVAVVGFQTLAKVAHRPTVRPGSADRIRTGKQSDGCPRADTTNSRRPKQRQQVRTLDRRCGAAKTGREAYWADSALR